MHEVAWVHAERVGHLQDVVKGQVASATLDLAEERPVHIAICRKLLLALTQFLTTPSNAGTELGGSR